MAQAALYERGSGRTTNQIEAAAQGAYYICPTRGALDYTRHLAHNLGRADIKLFTVSALDTFHGASIPELVIDHAAYEHMTARQLHELDKLRFWLKSKNIKVQSYGC